MIVRVAAGLAGVVVAVVPLPLLLLPFLIAQGAVTNECVFDGGAEDCYGTGTRLLMGGWSLCGFGAAAALAYVGGAGVYYAFTARVAPRLGLVLGAGLLLVLIGFFPFLPAQFG
jgi:hypothetical protein